MRYFLFSLSLYLFLNCKLSSQTVYVRFMWTADPCMAPHNRMAAEDLKTPKSASGMLISLIPPQTRHELRLEADINGIVQIKAEEGLWQVFTAEKRRHYGNLAERDSACMSWKNSPNITFSLEPPFPDSISLVLHRTCPPCNYLLPKDK